MHKFRSQNNDFIHKCLWWKFESDVSNRLNKKGVAGVSWRQQWKRGKQFSVFEVYIYIFLASRFCGMKQNSVVKLDQPDHTCGQPSPHMLIRTVIGITKAVSPREGGGVGKVPWRKAIFCPHGPPRRKLPPNFVPLEPSKIRLPTKIVPEWKGGKID